MINRAINHAISRESASGMAMIRGRSLLFSKIIQDFQYGQPQCLLDWLVTVLPIRRAVIANILGRLPRSIRSKIEDAMTKRNKQAIKAALFAALLYLSAAAQSQTITGKVVAISDGDTITVLDANNRQHKIRLDGIDAPESSQDWGSRAKQSLSDMVFGKTVTVISSKKDTYGRTLGKVMLDKQDINLGQVLVDDELDLPEDASPCGPL